MEPRPIAAGRASEILDLGGGRVLRCFKAGGDPEREERDEHAGLLARLHDELHALAAPTGL